MTKSDAIAIFGTTVTELARALGITRSAVSQWNDVLRQDQEDRVIGAAVRLGKLSAVEAPADGCHELSDGEPERVAA